MVFGQPSEFAVEIYHEPSGPRWHGFGRMAIDIQGIRLGDIGENHCSLFDAIGRIRRKSQQLESLWDESFNQLSDLEIFRTIDRRLFIGDTGNGARDEWWSFDFLTNSGEQFDDAKTYIVCRPNDRIHILYQFRDDTIGSGSCTANSYRLVAESVAQWFDEQVQTAGPPYFPVQPDIPN